MMMHFPTSSHYPLCLHTPPPRMHVPGPGNGSIWSLTGVGQVVGLILQCMCQKEDTAIPSAEKADNTTPATQWGVLGACIAPPFPFPPLMWKRKWETESNCEGKRSASWKFEEARTSMGKRGSPWQFASGVRWSQTGPVHDDDVKF